MNSCLQGRSAGKLMQHSGGTEPSLLGVQSKDFSKICNTTVYILFIIDVNSQRAALNYSGKLVQKCECSMLFLFKFHLSKKQ